MSLFDFGFVFFLLVVGITSFLAGGIYASKDCSSAPKEEYSESLTLRLKF